MKASELKKGDTFRKQGYKFTVVNIVEGGYKNGTPSILVECTMNDSKIVDSFFNFKLNTRVN